MHDLEFNPAYFDTIKLIHARADTMLPGIKFIGFLMDMQAANGVNGNDHIDFERLLAADDANFAHDVFGIIRHMNRDTGKLGDFFVPRFARHCAAA